MSDDSAHGQPVSREDYKRAESQLRVELINAQYDLRDAPFPVLVLVNGDASKGCDEVVDLLHEWMDARYLDTRVLEAPTNEERERPRFWRYWRALPPKGRIGIFLGAWTRRAIDDRASNAIGDESFARQIAEARLFERTLVEDGVLIVKFWLAEDVEEDPVAYRFLEETTAPASAWIPIDATPRRVRNLMIMRVLLRALRDRLDDRLRPLPSPWLDAVAGAPLADVDLTAQLEDDEYDQRLEKAQSRLKKRVHKARRRGITTVLAFEGWDAAGKGGVIRRITGPLHARDYRLIPIGAPSEEERKHHYLWRFWHRLPRAGRMLIFDRSWYGRVLVERVEGFATDDEWRRAYDEINAFEEQLVDHGIVLLKFWLHIEPDEQLRRFRAREQTPYKKYKLTDDDYRNRDKWDDYETAANEMVLRTNTDTAPWHLIAANDKKHARVRALETVCESLKHRLRQERE